jgi:hypothetical protein
MAIYTRRIASCIGPGPSLTGFWRAAWRGAVMRVESLRQTGGDSIADICVDNPVAEQGLEIFDQLRELRSDP